MITTGAKIAISALEKNGVSVIFGYPGATICPLVDAVTDSKIEYLLTANEQGAAHMASGYARVTRKAGVCAATSGPGATNLITGIATAYMDSVPMVAITGQVQLSMVGKDAFQEVDITGSTHPFTKHNYLVDNIEDIPRIIDEAFYIATTGRPGPVLIDIPIDILLQEYNYEPSENSSDLIIRGYKPNRAKPNMLQLKKAAELIKKADKPVLLAGGGLVLSNAESELRNLICATKIPVVSTMTGIGTIECDNPLFYGMIGSHGRKTANAVLNASDLIVVIGSRLADRSVANAESGKQDIIHIDIDPAEIGKSMTPNIPVVGDAKDVLEQLLPLLDGYTAPDSWAKETEEFRTKLKTTLPTEDNGYVNPPLLIKKLSARCTNDDFVSTEVGQNQIWTVNNFNFSNSHQLITSAGFGTMGYGLPAAIGASKASGGRVIAVMGDGSFQMDFNELATAQRYKIPVKMVLFENKRLGMVNEIQYLRYNSNHIGVYLDGSPDFEKIAEAYGIPSMRISANSEIDTGLDRLFADSESFLLVVSVDPNEPTGGAVNTNRLGTKTEV